MTNHYLSRVQVAEYIGVKEAALTDAPLPPPDAVIGTTHGWHPATIDLWQNSPEGWPVVQKALASGKSLNKKADTHKSAKDSGWSESFYVKYVEGEIGLADTEYRLKVTAAGLLVFQHKREGHIVLKAPGTWTFIKGSDIVDPTL